MEASSGHATLITTPDPFVLTTTTDVGFDFDPGVDQIKIVTDNARNFRVDPNAGTIIDGDPNTGGIQGDKRVSINGIVAAAYGRNFGDPLATLYAIDKANNALVRIGPMDTPLATVPVVSIGALGVEVLDVAGLDAASPGSTGYAAVTTADGQTRVVQIHPATGAATSIGLLARSNGPPAAVRDIAVLIFPPAAYAVTRDNHLLRFKTHQPGFIFEDHAITGLASGEFLIALEMQRKGSLLGISTFGHLYDIAPDTGAARRLPLSSTLPLSPLARGFGMTLDPVAGILRLVDDIRMNVTIDVWASGTDHDAHASLPGRDRGGRLFGHLRRGVHAAWHRLRG